MTRRRNIDATIDACFRAGSQYYIVGRFAAFARLNPGMGNLLHLAIEMFLKGGLSKTKTLDELKKPPFGHDLTAIWRAFKNQADDAALDRFDGTIVDLNAYDELWYPDSILKKGMASTTNIVRTDAPGAVTGPAVPEYQICLQDIDELVEAIFSAAQRNPQAYLIPRWGPAHEFLIKENTASKLTTAP
jgi:hypothetical protein